MFKLTVLYEMNENLPDMTANAKFLDVNVSSDKTWKKETTNI
jgi:hypothetical protein